MVRVIPVAPEWLEDGLSIAMPNLIKAASRSRHLTPMVLAEGIRDGLLHLWLIDGMKAACVTQVVEYPDERVLFVSALGGEEMSDWLDDLLDTLDAYAKRIGAGAIEMHGRKGWQKILNWETDKIIMRREI